MWSVVVPVKPRTHGKSRLAGAVPPELHAQLSAAIAADTIDAIAGCSRVLRVVVVTDDPHLAGEIVGDATGATVTVIEDAPRAGLNDAMTYGVRWLRAHAAGAVALMPADLPALRSVELAGALSACEQTPNAVVADASGTGTTLLSGLPAHPPLPRFGTASLAAHVDSGAIPLRGDWSSLRRDVDTVGDLRAAARIGLGPRTAAMAAHTLL